MTCTCASEISLCWSCRQEQELQDRLSSLENRVERLESALVGGEVKSTGECGICGRLDCKGHPLGGGQQ